MEGRCPGRRASRRRTRAGRDGRRPPRRDCGAVIRRRQDAFHAGRLASRSAGPPPRHELTTAARATRPPSGRTVNLGRRERTASSGTRSGTDLLRFDGVLAGSFSRWRCHRGSVDHPVIPGPRSGVRNPQPRRALSMAPSVIRTCSVGGTPRSRRRGDVIRSHAISTRAGLMLDQGLATAHFTFAGGRSGTRTDDQSPLLADAERP